MSSPRSPAENTFSPRANLLTVPHLRDVNVGDVLVLDEIHELGSREYTLRGNPVIPPGSVKVEATVVEHTKGNMGVHLQEEAEKGLPKDQSSTSSHTRVSELVLSRFPLHHSTLYHTILP